MQTGEQGRAPSERPRPPIGVIGDIGGTHHRFALVGADGSLQSLHAAENTRHASFESALRAYLQDVDCEAVDAIAVAVAGPVLDGRAALTNCDWQLDIDLLGALSGARTVRLENDLQAAARALPLLAEDAVASLGPARQGSAGNRAIVGLGTGLGLAALVADGSGGQVALATEGGHGDIAPRGDRERELLACLASGRPGLTAEELLAGPGFGRLHACVCALRGDPAPARRMRVSEAFRTRDNPAARESADLYTGLLGSFATTAALMFTATGGVYFAGSIAQEIAPLLDTTALRDRFEGRWQGLEEARGWLASVPLRVVNHPHPTLVGLAQWVGASPTATYAGSPAARW